MMGRRNTVRNAGQITTPRQIINPSKMWQGPNNWKKRRAITWRIWHVWREEKCTQGLVVKPEGNRLLGSPRCRWHDNTKIDRNRIKNNELDLSGLG
jgi:hypothetical protein